MKEVVSIVKPETILVWQRRLERNKWDYGERRSSGPLTVALIPGDRARWRPSMAYHVALYSVSPRLHRAHGLLYSAGVDIAHECS